MIRHIIIFLLLTPLFVNAQSLYFEGSWTKNGTSYEFPFQLILIHEDNAVEGYFLWQIQELDHNNTLSKAYYEKKLGLNAKEFVRGSYNPNNRTYTLKGYRKEDPHNIIALDTYKLTISNEGTLTGTTRSNGSWLGRIDGKEYQLAL